MTTAAQAFTWPVRVYVEDTDFGGVVFYANYLKYFERARTELLRSVGVTQQAMVESHRVIFVVTSATVDYLAPARMDEELSVTANIEKLGRVSIIFTQEVRRGLAVLAKGRVSVACVGVASMRPQSMPPALLRSIRAASSD